MKSEKVTFLKNKNNIEEIDTNKISVSKKRIILAQNIYLSFLLDIMIMMLLDHYI